jgi:hypothetical protein
VANLADHPLLVAAIWLIKLSISSRKMRKMHMWRRMDLRLTESRDFAKLQVMGPMLLLHQLKSLLQPPMATAIAVATLLSAVPVM